MPTTSKKIQYGKRDALQGSDFKNPKVRITMMVDEEIVRAFRERAVKEGEGYQTLMNRALREAMNKPSLEERVARIEEALKLGV
jgi:uncharacterized protein (DUF4415 family)